MTSNTGLTTSRKARRQALEIGLDRSVQVIRNASGLILESMAAIGRELIRVRDQQLWLARHGSYNDFLENEVKIAESTGRKYCELSVKWDSLQKQLDGHPMPKTADEIRALDGVPEEYRGQAWILALKRAEDLDMPMNSIFVKSAVRENFLIEVEKTPVEVCAEKITDIGHARIRIGKLCGGELLSGIDRRKWIVSEKEMLVWARQTDENVEYIGRCVRLLGWGVQRALERCHDVIDADMSIRRLVAKAKAMDVSLVIKIHGWKVSVKPE
jgi:hypothetical protein